MSSLKEGQLEVMMDRRLLQDDFRGLSQGVQDNVKTPESFVVFLEHWKRDSLKKSSSSLSYPSLAAHRLSWELLHPFRSMSVKTAWKSTLLYSQFVPLMNRLWPCDIHLLNLRSIQHHDKLEPTDQSALLLHRVGRECAINFAYCFQSICHNNDVNGDSNVTIASLLRVREAIPTSLSLQKNGLKLKTNSTIAVRPMEIESFKIKLK